MKNQIKNKSCKGHNRTLCSCQRSISKPLTRGDKFNNQLVIIETLLPHVDLALWLFPSEWPEILKKRGKREPALVCSCNQQCVFMRTVPGPLWFPFSPVEKHTSTVYGPITLKVSNHKSACKIAAIPVCISLALGVFWLRWQLNKQGSVCNSRMFISEVKLSGAVTRK